MKVTQEELEVLTALINELKGVRRVRDSAYWGAPVGTPLPLPSTGIPEDEFDLPPIGFQQYDKDNPPPYLYRAVSEEDWRSIQENGYIQSDERMNIASGEGTVAADRDPSWYLPNGVGSMGRIIRMEYSEEDGWWKDDDGYWKTPKRIPLSRVDVTTPPRIDQERLDEYTYSRLAYNLSNRLYSAIIDVPGYDGRGLLSDFRDNEYALSRRVPRDNPTREDLRVYLSGLREALAQAKASVETEYDQKDYEALEANVSRLLDDAERAMALLDSRNKKALTGNENIDPLLKRANDVIRELEKKANRRGVVRHVRTPEGARRYGQPIGSVIVADRRMSNFREITSDWEGYDKYRGINGTNYWVYQEGNRWYAVDDDNNDIFDASSEEEIFKMIEEDAKSPYASPDRGNRGHPETWGGKLGKNWRPATGDDWIDGLLDRHPVASQDKSKALRLAPAWVDVWVNTDPDADVLAIGFDGADRMQRLYTSRHKMRVNAAKFKRIELLHKKIGKLDTALDADYKSNDVASVVYIIRETGFRPGSDGDTRAKVDAYGISNLEARHVRINQNSVTLEFVGKEGVEQKFVISDPRAVEILTKAKQGKRNKDKLFPGVTQDKLNDYVRDILGVGFTIKDLRTLKANVAALAEIKKITPRKQPKTKTEYRKLKNKIAGVVADQLGNRAAQAISSYINPMLWFMIANNNPDWATEDTEKIVGKDS